MLMTPQHPKWEEFIMRLEGPEGCNFQEDENGKITWECNCGTDKPKATAILMTIPGIHIEESLDYFEMCEGYCDCEIILNVATSDLAGVME